MYNKIKTLPNAKQKVSIELSKRKLSFADLAKMTEYSPEHISRVFSGTIHPSQECCEKICKKLDFKFDDLFTRDERLPRFNRDVMTDEELEFLKDAINHFCYQIEDNAEYSKIANDMLEELK